MAEAVLSGADLAAELAAAKAALEPIGDRVLILRDEAAEKSEGGILDPTASQTKLPTGLVVAVGPGGRDHAGELIPPQVKPGDRVFFDGYSEQEIELRVPVDGEKVKRTYLLMREDSILTRLLC